MIILYFRCIETDVNHKISLKPTGLELVLIKFAIILEVHSKEIDYNSVSFWISVNDFKFNT